MAETQAQAAVRLEQLGASLDKISGETTSLVEAVRDLKEKAGNADPAVTAAIDKLLGQAASIDAKVDDLAPTPTPTPPGDTGTPPAGDTGTGADAGGAADAGTAAPTP